MQGLVAAVGLQLAHDVRQPRLVDGLHDRDHGRQRRAQHANPQQRQREPQQAEAAIDQAAQALTAARDAASGQVGRLSVGFAGTMLYRGLPQMLRRFQAEHARLQLTLRELSSSEQIVELQHARLDAGFAHVAHAPEGLAQLLVSSQPFVACVPAAHALARFGGDLENMPPEALRLPAATVAGLRDMGFGRIGDLLAQPRAPLTRRFGPELIRRIDQMFGDVPEPIAALRPADLIETRRAFAEPIAAPETIARYIAKLVAALCAQLEAQGLGARRLDLICHRTDREMQTVRVGLAVAQRDPARLTRLLCDKIPSIAPGFGIEIMTLSATIAEPLAARQTSTLAPEAPDLSGLIDILANRVGAQAIYRMAPVDSDVPERSSRRIPALAEDSGAGWPHHWPRPSRLLPRPEAIDTMALLPDQPPVWIAWRGVRRRIARADGPERIFGEWWTREAERIAVRDYFRVEDDAGERLWIFRAGDGEDAATGSHRWFLHGIFG